MVERPGSSASCDIKVCPVCGRREIPRWQPETVVREKGIPRKLLSVRCGQEPLREPRIADASMLQAAAIRTGNQPSHPQAEGPAATLEEGICSNLKIWS